MTVFAQKITNIIIYPADRFVKNREQWRIRMILSLYRNGLFAYGEGCFIKKVQGIAIFYGQILDIVLKKF